MPCHIPCRKQAEYGIIYMMNDRNEVWYVRSEEGMVYGPTDIATLTTWAQEGRIEPSGHISKDRKSWVPAQLMKELEMCWVIEAEPGKFFGPFNRQVVIRLSRNGEISEGANVYLKYPLDVEKDPEPVVIEKVVEKRVEVPVEKIVERIIEKRVEVPVEVEKIVERIVEVEPPARHEIVEPEVIDAVAAQPPPPKVGGIFKNVNPSKLAALEAAAQRELMAVGKHGMPKSISSLFLRRK